MKTGKECSRAECARLRSRLHCVTTRRVASTRQGVRRAPPFDFRHRPASCVRPAPRCPCGLPFWSARTRPRFGTGRRVAALRNYSLCPPDKSRIRKFSGGSALAPALSPRSGRIIRCLFWRPWLPELAGGPSGIQQTSSLDCPSRVAAPGDGRTPGAFIRRSRQRFWLEEVLANIRSSVVRR